MSDHMFEPVYQHPYENDGETIVLMGADGSAVRDFTYNDVFPWPKSADFA